MNIGAVYHIFPRDICRMIPIIKGVFRYFCHNKYRNRYEFENGSIKLAKQAANIILFQITQKKDVLANSINVIWSA